MSLSISTGPVVAAVTADDYVGNVLEIAHDLAERLGLELVVAHAEPADIPPGVSTVPSGQARLKEEREREANELLDGLLAEHAPRLVARRVLISGSASTALEKVARDESASLLVIGSAGKGALATALSGSVSRHVATHAPCPVVVVPPEVSA
jgi:nucleotide-binding universal stress UspA family protein